MAKDSKGKQRLVILDTHAILHRAYHALPDFSSSKGEPTGALYGVITMLLRIVNDLKPDYIIAAYDLPGGTFRHDAYEKYKANRMAADDDLITQIKRSRDVLDAFSVPRYEAQGFEADDVIGTIVEETKNQKDLEVVIASGDMDTTQLVDGTRVQVFTLRKGLTDTVIYDERGVEARYGFGPKLVPDYKGLRGDPSDNIPGVKGIGEKTATILISHFGSIENLYAILKKDPKKVAAAGVSQGMIDKLIAGEEDAKFSKMLAEIRRDAPIKFKLPQETWRESVDAGKTLDMLAEFEFRSLVPRVKSALTGEKSSKETIFSERIATPEESAAQHMQIAPGELADTALAAWVLDSSITEPTIDDILRVGKSKDFAQARAHILEEIKEKELTFVFEDIERPLMPILRAMESRGVCVDKDFLQKLSKDYTKELEKIAGRIYKAAGGEFNIQSPKQLGEVLFDKLGLTPEKQKKTSGGQRSTKESELQKLKGMHPIIEDILMHRELSKLLGTYIDTLPTLLDEHSRVHTTFIQTGAATGRLASKDPNLQNIPIKTELGRAIRHAFVADEGYKLLSFDYSQIELRIAAFLSGDEGLAEIFREGRDVHSEVASRVFHVGSGDVTYEMRRRAKVINFGILYGMGVTALQQTLGTNRKEAQEFHNAYFEAFPQLAAYIEEVKNDAMRQGYTKTYFGRRRYFDGIRSPIPYVRAAAERMAINAPMQGTQADVVKLAMIKIYDLFQSEAKGDACLLLQVHDELIFEIKEPLIKKLAPKIKDLMEEVIPAKDRRDIPFITEGKVGDNWGEMEKLKM